MHNFFFRESPEKILQALNSLIPSVQPLGDRRFTIKEKEKDTSIRRSIPNAISYKEIILSIKENKHRMTKAVIDRLVELDVASQNLYHQEAWYQRLLSNVIDAFQLRNFNKDKEIENLIADLKVKESERESSLLTAIAYTESKNQIDLEKEAENWKELLDSYDFEIGTIKQILEASTLQNNARIISNIIMLPSLSTGQRNQLYNALNSFPNLAETVTKKVYEQNPKYAPLDFSPFQQNPNNPFRDTWR